MLRPLRSQRILIIINIIDLTKYAVVAKNTQLMTDGRFLSTVTFAPDAIAVSATFVSSVVVLLSALSVLLLSILLLSGSG